MGSRFVTRFDAPAFHDALATTAIGRFMVYRETVDTTMVLARREADEGAPHGTLVLAEEQTAGRGRKGRSFQSPPGENLYFTFVLRCPVEQHRRLPVAVPLAVVAAVQAEGVDAAIKWPNDIWAGDRKLCGMLIDAELTAAGAIALPGIGINVNGDPARIPELRDIATSLERELGRRVHREALLARICNELEAALLLGPAELARRYRERSLVIGRRVRVTPLAGEPYEALAMSIGNDGSLVVERDDGKLEDLNAAEVTLRPAVPASRR
ncbi:MAG: biotin--[acetyl-CoA-carboxylase] ligase [Anaerolinea sp.]|nr:biotin--[acetyl-CoA-carboxylase] ligase [Anaerolinea sp.]